MSRRIELGISLEQAARDTNIRARMLEIFESCDYSQFPARGHAIGMLSSYARYLGLDSAAIVEAFDVEFESFNSNQEIAQMASNTKRGVGRFGERISEGKSRPINREQSRSRSQRRRSGTQTESTSKLSQNLKDEALAKDDERYKSGSVRVVGTRQTGSFRAVRGSRPSSRSSSVPPSSSASFRKVPSDTGSMRRTTGQTGSMRRTSQSGTIPRFTPSDSFAPVDETAKQDESSTPNFFGVDVDSNKPSRKRSSRRRSSARDVDAEQSKSSVNDTIFTRARAAIVAIFSETRTRIIAIAAIVIVVAVIVAASILISTAGHSNSGIISVQGGVDNETQVSEGDNASHKTITTANGNPVLIKIEVAKGETSLVEITYDGGNAYKGTAVGGQFSQEFPVTESFSATFSNPAAVTVTENGNPMEIPLNEDGKTGSLFISIQTTSK